MPVYSYFTQIKPIPTLNGTPFVYRKGGGKMNSYKILIESNDRMTLYRSRDDLKFSKVEEFRRDSVKDIEILLIDDDSLSLNSLARALTLNGIKVDPFQDPVKALQKFIQTRNPIILSDIMMPGIDGFDILKRVKSINSETKVILFTGFYTEEIGQKAKLMGADKLFRKPVQTEQLIDLINLLKNRGSIRETV